MSLYVYAIVSHFLYGIVKLLKNKDVLTVYTPHISIYVLNIFCM